MLQGVSAFVTAYSREVPAEVKNIKGMVFWSWTEFSVESEKGKVQVQKIGEMLQVNVVHVLCYSKRVSRFVTGGVSLRQLQNHIASSV